MSFRFPMYLTHNNVSILTYNINICVGVCWRKIFSHVMLLTRIKKKKNVLDWDTRHLQSDNNKNYFSYINSYSVTFSLYIYAASGGLLQEFLSIFCYNKCYSVGVTHKDILKTYFGSLVSWWKSDMFEYVINRFIILSLLKCVRWLI